MIPEGADRHATDEGGRGATRDGRALARLRAELQEIQLLLDGLRSRLRDAERPREDGCPDDPGHDDPGRPFR